MSTLPRDEGEADIAEEGLQSYLDELLLALRGRPREVRRLLIEVETHLRDAIAANTAAGLDRRRATDEALKRFGPPSAVARGVSSMTAYAALVVQVIEVAVAVVSALCLAAGVAAIPAAILGLIGNPELVTGDQPDQALTPDRCQQLFRMVPTPNCARALALHHLQEILGDHFFLGWFGFITLGMWWVVHVRSKTHPTVLPTGFNLTVCGTALAAVGVFLLCIGVHDLALGTNSTGGQVGPLDLVATGSTVLAAATLSAAVLARQATRPARNLPATPMSTTTN